MRPALPRLHERALHRSPLFAGKAARHVDLGFFRFDRHGSLPTLPHDLAVLMVEMAARQAASPTAAVFARGTRARPDSPLFAPLDGAFNGAVAQALTRWEEE